MGGDITRSTFHRRKHYRKVGMQQGRVQLDADWNEQVDIDSHHEKTLLNDAVGHSGTPVDSLNGYSDGFKIVAPPSITVTLVAPGPNPQLAVQGSGFTPWSLIPADSMVCDGGLTSHAPIATGPTGSFQAVQVLVVSTLFSGTYVLTVTDQNGVTAEATFQNGVTAGATFHPGSPGLLNVSPSNGLPGTQVTVTGSGFPAGASVTLRWEESTSPAITTVTVNADSTLPTGVQFAVPAWEAAGSHKLLATNGAGDVVYATGIFTDVEYTIRHGRYYVDGILCENEEDTLATKQPDLPSDTTQPTYPVPSAPGVYIVFLDVWERELTSIEDPLIREVALLGPDTTTRKKVVWQVKSLVTQMVPTHIASSPVWQPLPPAPPTHVVPPPIRQPLPPAPASGLRASTRKRARALLHLARGSSRELAVPATGTQATISVSPSVAAPGTQITMTGAGFQKGETITLTFANANLTTTQGTPLQVNADTNGNLGPTVFLVPEVPLGSYSLVALGQTSATTASTSLTVVDCSKANDAWTKFLAQSGSTGRLRARAVPPAPNSQPCVIPPQAGYTGLENQLYRVEVHAAGQVPATGSSPLPTFKWSRNNASILAGITDIANNMLTVTGTGKDGNLGFVGDPASPPVWVEVISDLQELWGKAGTLAPLTNAGDGTLTFDATKRAGPNIDSTNYPLGMNPKVRRWDCSGPCTLSQPDNSGYIDLENGIQVKFEAGQYNVGDYWLIPARTVAPYVEWPHQTNKVDWSKVTSNSPAPSDSSALADFLIQTLGVSWIQNQPFTQNTSNPSEIDVASSDGKHTLSLTLGSAPLQVTIGIDSKLIGQTISVVGRAGLSMLQCLLPAPLPPKGIEHHYERLALIQTDGSGNLIPIADCRELFPALTDVPRLFYVSGDGQTANPPDANGYCQLPSPLMAATWFGRVRFTIVKGNGTLSIPFNASPPSATVNGQGSFLDVSPGSGSPDPAYADLDGIASCSWKLDQKSSQQQLVRADLLDNDGNLTDETPLYYSAVLQSPQTQAVTGIIELPINVDMPLLMKNGSTLVFGAFQHFSPTKGVPPTIILSYVGFKSSRGGVFPSPNTGRVEAMEDAGLYPFSTQNVPGVFEYDNIQRIPPAYLYQQYSTQMNPVPIPLFKALFVDDTYFSVGVDKLVLPTNAAGVQIADTLVLRWWAMPAVTNAQANPPDPKQLWWNQ